MLLAHKDPFAWVLHQKAPNHPKTDLSRLKPPPYDSRPSCNITYSSSLSENWTLRLASG